MQVTFLGTGTSHGVPSLDCMINSFSTCPKGVCRASLHDPRHSRTRSSILLEYHDRTVLIDVSMDFRQQALANRIKSLDAVLLTHCHADHIGGIPDIRSYTRTVPLPFYGSAETIARIRAAYTYIFNPPAIPGGGIPRLETCVVTDPFDLFGLQVTPIPVVHGSLQGCLGFRVGPLAYLPDLKSISDDSLSLLQGVECLILDCLRTGPVHTTHLILPESLALARRIAPRRCYFTHLCHEINYEVDSALLDPGISFACDGQTFTLCEAKSYFP